MNPVVGERRVFWRIFWVAATIRCLFFLISVNGAGTDGAPRALVAYEWSREPVWVTAGHWLPLQIWVSGALLWLWNDVWLVPRLVSLGFGIATIWPLMRLTREFFSREVTIATGVLFALFGLHIYQCSSAGGEAMYFFFVFWALFHQVRWWTTLQSRSLVLAGLFWIPATLTRHEAWWVAPLCVLLALVRALTDARRAKLVLPVMAFGVLAAIGPVFWMSVCAAVKGDALLSFHRAAAGAAYHARSPVYKLAFWPVGMTLALGPVVMALALWGLARSVRQRERLLLAGFMLAFVLPFWAIQLVGRGGVNIRHTLFVGTLLLPFSAVALEPHWVKRGRSLTRFFLAIGAAWLLLVFALGETKWGEFSRKFASISPRAKDRPHVMDAAGWVAGHAQTTDRVVVDHFNDEESSLQFHVRLPPEQVTICWGRPADLRAFLTPLPRWLIAAARGPLGQALAASDLPVIPRYSNEVYTVYEVVPSS
jgi:hypothetical protein